MTRASAKRALPSLRFGHDDVQFYFRDFFRDLRTVSPGLTKANVPE
jgi:hypothetical protein